MIQQIPLWGIYPKKMKTLIQKDICTQHSQQHYLHSQDVEAT